MCLHKSFWRGTKCSLIFGLAQIWTGTKHFGTCKGQIILKAIFVFLTSSKKRTKKIWHDMIWPLKGQGNSVHDFTLDLIPVKILNLITCNLCSVLYCTFRKRFIILRFGCYAVTALHSSLHFAYLFCNFALILLCTCILVSLWISNKREFWLALKNIYYLPILQKCTRYKATRGSGSNLHKYT